MRYSPAFAQEELDVVFVVPIAAGIISQVPTNKRKTQLIEVFPTAAIVAKSVLDNIAFVIVLVLHELISPVLGVRAGHANIAAIIDAVRKQVDYALNHLEVWLIGILVRVRPW